MDRFKIFPSIGIARLGGSNNQFFLCPETENSLGIEIGTAGNETEIKNFKDSSGLIKRQGARFKIFELDSASNEYLPIDMNSVSVEWQVSLVNKKAGVNRGLNEPPNEPPANAPQLPFPLRENSNDLIINGGEKKISGKNKSGVLFDSGKYKQTSVFLGELQTDINGNLIVLGGHGISKSPSNHPLANEGGGDFYYSEDWFDDTSDGFVKAIVTLGDGTTIEASSSWVIVAPPDYAPAVKGLVTLFDIIEELFSTTPPNNTSFKENIQPLINRFANYTWVHNKDYSIPYPLSELNDSGQAAKPKRTEVRAKILTIQTRLQGFALTSIQLKHLDNWVSGSFTSDYNTPTPTSSTGQTLTRNVLNSTVGQGFYPGIEGGIILKNSSIYKEPFRLNLANIKSGDVTGMMALPWQADFLKCRTNWWPSQRPDTVKLADNSKQQWERGILQGANPHQNLVDNFNKLGFVKPVGQEQIESERSL